MPPISAFAAYKNMKKEIMNKHKRKKIRKFKNDKTQKGKKRKFIRENGEENEILTDSTYEKLQKVSKCTDDSKSSSEDYEEIDDGPLQSEDNGIEVSSHKKKLTKARNLQAFVNEFAKFKDNIGASNILKSSNDSNAPAMAMLSTVSVNSVVKTNSIQDGKKLFEWVISPVKVSEFFLTYWEQNSLLVRRDSANFYSSLISFKAIDQMFLDHHVEFTKNIDVTTYENGVRETHNPEGRALPPTVWDFYRDGCSIRLLNPQTFLKPLHELCAKLQEYFHCLVGANAYLTPPNSQGFAPHYDDIEAFVLQIEGKKRWKVYSPRSLSEALPRFSSKNFTQEEIGEPILDQVLEPGDLLYFPRGAIHQASTEPGYHSLHITISVYQKQSYADLLEKMLPALLKKAIDSNINLRRGLPLNIWHNAGIVYSDVETQERVFLEKKINKIVAECLQSVQFSEIIDTAVDELAKKFQHEALPPFISSAEKPHTIFGILHETDTSGDCLLNCCLELRTNVRLLRANILRLVSEEEQIRIYYYLDNSKEYCEYEPNFFEIEPILAGSVEVLIKSYPEFISVSQLPLEDDESKLGLITSLWNRGLLMTEKPIKNL